MPLSAAHETPLSANYASLLMLPTPTAVRGTTREVEEGDGRSERPLPLLRLVLRLLLCCFRPPTRRHCRSPARV